MPLGVHRLGGQYIAIPGALNACRMQAVDTIPAAAAMACTALCTRVLLALHNLEQVAALRQSSARHSYALADTRGCWQALQPKLAEQHPRTEELQKAADMVQEFMLCAAPLGSLEAASCPVAGDLVASACACPAGLRRRVCCSSCCRPAAQRAERTLTPGRELCMRSCAAPVQRGSSAQGWDGAGRALPARGRCLRRALPRVR